MSRDLNDVFAGNDQINKDLFTYTEYLTTLIAIVPTSNMKDWENGYERLDDCILPKSNLVLPVKADIGSYKLCRFVCFNRVVDNVKQAAKKVLGYGFCLSKKKGFREGIRI